MAALGEPKGGDGGPQGSRCGGGGQESALCAGWGLSVPGAWGGLEGPEQGLRALVGPLRTRSVRHYLSTEGAALRSAKAFLVWQASSMRRRRTVLKAARQRWCRGPAGVPEATDDVRKDLEEVWGLEAACQPGEGSLGGQGIAPWGCPPGTILGTAGV